MVIILFSFAFNFLETKTILPLMYFHLQITP